VYTDHRNLTFHTLHTQRVLRWRLFLEEYGPTFHYIAGKNSLAADALSRLPFSERQISSPSPGPFPEKPADVVRPPKRVDSFYSFVTDDPDLLDCFVHLPDQYEVPFNMDFHTLARSPSTGRRTASAGTSKAATGTT
jgi:hypothetical protein